ncbi:MAG: hypothetical protein IJT16_14095, partial [Lachnospiraceae bacterium]|nr:hypothetical protein [Lachnospiraceae bacterium]
MKGKVSLLRYILIAGLLLTAGLTACGRSSSSENSAAANYREEPYEAAAEASGAAYYDEDWDAVEYEEEAYDDSGIAMQKGVLTDDPGSNEEIET